jgi:Mn2+/Fe2+ NRAMP family transporter
MRNIRFWIPSIIGALITPLCLYASLVSAGAGHGSYGPLLILYPGPTFVTVFFAGIAPDDAFLSQIIRTVSMVLVFGSAILQFPLYGFVLSYAKLKKAWWLTLCVGIIWLHMIGIGVWLVITIIMGAVSRI